MMMQGPKLLSMKPLLSYHPKPQQHKHHSVSQKQLSLASVRIEPKRHLIIDENLMALHNNNNPSIQVDDMANLNRQETTAPVSPHSLDSGSNDNGSSSNFNFEGTQTVTVRIEHHQALISPNRVRQRREESLEDCEVRDDDEEQAIFHPNENSDTKNGKNRLTGGELKPTA